MTEFYTIEWRGLGWDERGLGWDKWNRILGFADCAKLDEGRLADGVRDSTWGYKFLTRAGAEIAAIALQSMVWKRDFRVVCHPDPDNRALDLAYLPLLWEERHANREKIMATAAREEKFYTLNWRVAGTSHWSLYLNNMQRGALAGMTELGGATRHPSYGYKFDSLETARSAALALQAHGRWDLQIVERDLDGCSRVELDVLLYEDRPTASAEGAPVMYQVQALIEQSSSDEPCWLVASGTRHEGYPTVSEARQKMVERLRQEDEQRFSHLLAVRVVATQEIMRQDRCFHEDVALELGAGAASATCKKCGEGVPLRDVVHRVEELMKS